MKFKASLLVAAAFWLASIGAAHATPATFSDTFTPIADTLLSSPGQDTFAFTLDLTNGPNGFRPGIDTLEDAFLLVVLTDNSSSTFGQVSFNFDGTGFQPPQALLFGGFAPDLFTFSPLQFLGDGRLNVSLKATQGDFFFDTAVLTANGMRVPEPASLALLSVGLFGMGMVVRRRSADARALRAR